MLGWRQGAVRGVAAADAAKLGAGVTAGHCVLGERAAGMTVLVGRSRLTERGGRQLPVTGISVFRAYQGPAPGLDAAVNPLTIQPESVSPTRIRGRFAVGRVLTCVRGRFTGSPARYAAAWTWVTPSGVPTQVVGRSWRHTVTRSDRRHRLTCTVVAYNDGGTFTEQAKPLVP